MPTLRDPNPQPQDRGRRHQLSKVSDSESLVWGSCAVKFPVKLIYDSPINQ